MKLNFFFLIILIIINFSWLKLVGSTGRSNYTESKSFINQMKADEYVWKKKSKNQLKRQLPMQTDRKDSGKMDIKWIDESPNLPMFAVFSLNQRKSSISVHESKKGTKFINTRKDYKHKPI